MNLIDDILDEFLHIIFLLILNLLGNIILSMFVLKKFVEKEVRLVACGFVDRIMDNNDSYI